MNGTLKACRNAFSILIFMSLLTGFLYPAFITIIAQIFFQKEANGNLIIREGYVIGSKLIGQYTKDLRYFWGRPSSTLPYPYNALLSSGSNQGPIEPLYLQTIKRRIAELKNSDPLHQAIIPIDLVTASASGLDPDISPLAAMYQAPRIAKARNIPETQVVLLIKQHINPPMFGILGEARVNVLTLNLSLDELTSKRGSP